ncbi:MAG: tryptophan 2,3-dioxygenase [Sphingobacteriales bacterium]|nr:MAG: tryptophan 2,3-dioxygenase [Sphingobacteriales bacterium]
MKTIDNRPPVYYSNYLQLDKILGAQAPESAKEGAEAPDEMLFIIIHQAYELWFKQMLHELDYVRAIFQKDQIENSSPDIYNALHRLKRVQTIVALTVQQMDIMETMTPLDFLDFRDFLRPASGFQSIQFKMIEAALGLQYDQRHGKGYYLSQLSEADIQRVKDQESKQSLLSLIEQWLERMPFADAPYSWNPSGTQEAFWPHYRDAYLRSLSDADEGNLAHFDALFIQPENYPAGRSLSAKATRSALFIMLYRDYPLLHLPYEILTALLSIDHGLGMWRQRHINMVRMTIGNRAGTGGSTGADYLRKAAETHFIFKELSELTSYLLPRQMLPKLPEALQKELSFCTPEAR